MTKTSAGASFRLLSDNCLFSTAYTEQPAPELLPPSATFGAWPCSQGAPHLEGGCQNLHSRTPQLLLENKDSDESDVLQGPAVLDSSGMLLKTFIFLFL